MQWSARLQEPPEIFKLLVSGSCRGNRLRLVEEIQHPSREPFQHGLWLFHSDRKVNCKMMMANPQNFMKWQTILLIVSSVTLPEMIAAQDSCIGRCVPRYERGHVCNCDIECIRYDECCEDYRDICTSETSCSGRCYEKHQRGRKCQCDPICVKYSDCCADFAANCEEDIQKSPMIVATTRSPLPVTSFTKKPTAAEIISDTLLQQDSANHLNDNGKIKEGPLKSKTETAKEIEVLTTVDPIKFKNDKDDPVVPENSSTDPQILDKRLKTTNVPEVASTNSNILVKETTATTTTVPGALDRGMTTYPTPEDGPNDSKILDKELTAAPESDFLNSKIPNNRMTAPTATKDASKRSEPLSNDPSVPVDQSNKSESENKGTPTIVPKDVSKILDKKMTANGSRISANGMSTAAPSAAVSKDTRISDKGMASLSVPVTGPAKNDNMVTKSPLPSVEPENQTTEKMQSYEARLNDPNLCNTKPSDASTTLQNGTTYIFRGNLFWTISQQGQTLGHPRSITDVWGIPSPIDTVFTRCNCKGQTYFFKDQDYWRFQNGAMDSGYPQKIAAGFSGLNGKITAALSVAAFNNRPETVYFFKRGGVYQKYVYQKSVSTCPQERTQSHAYQVVRHRNRRQTLVVIQKTRKQQNIVKLSVEMSIRNNWTGNSHENNFNHFTSKP
ncbi:proteoglycan 4b isoform X2 [Leucoraja erinacea]|uniref:proteoglycan 4b isoform X2 n=1 Tax=Leucoraja erinaceus TaxID=7782 RepID=UPI002455A078|nr:proteoglycan 4b isoform X2 [Leucoraja erinacea]